MFLKIIIILLLTAATLAAFFVLYFRYQLRKHRQPLAVHEAFPLPAATRTVMVIFAHPDDEIAIAGTLAQMKRQSNLQIVGVYLTAGEAGKTGGLVPKEKLAETRAQELQEAGKILGLQQLEILGFPDSGLKNTSPDTVKAALLAVIERYQPQVIISFDDKVGLYGHSDHLHTGRWLLEVCRQNTDAANFPVRQVYCPTLTDGMIELAMTISQTFKKNYPKGPNEGLPPPNFGIDISKQGKEKLQAIQAHRTQKHVFDDVFPFHDCIAPQWYFRLFGEEYYALIWEK
jgi:LmbE family N-acetylglucosaminyl deacetylase